MRKQRESNADAEATLKRHLSRRVIYRPVDHARRAATATNGTATAAKRTEHVANRLHLVSRLTDHDDFLALRPFFRIVEEALTGIVDGADFFDMLAKDIVVDYVITVPGYPRRVVGRDAIADLYRPYGTKLTLDRCFDLAVHHDRERGVIVLEYASEGSVVATGIAYANRYVSVLTIEGRKVTRWRDYLDPLAVFDALGWPQQRGESTRA